MLKRFCGECGGGLEISLPEAFRQLEMRQKKRSRHPRRPGAGKTTHLKRLLLWCLRKGPENLGLPTDMVPVFLPLRDLQDIECGLDAFIQDQLSSALLKTPQGLASVCWKRGICCSS